MNLTQMQQHQLNDVVTNTLITRGKNAGKRKDDNLCCEHFDMRAFNGLVHKKLVAFSEYRSNEVYATELGFSVWKANKQAS